jgi:hypothetical protein
MKSVRQNILVTYLYRCDFADTDKKVVAFIYSKIYRYHLSPKSILCKSRLFTGYRFNTHPQSAKPLVIFSNSFHKI